MLVVGNQTTGDSRVQNVWANRFPLVPTVLATMMTIMMKIMTTLKV